MKTILGVFVFLFLIAGLLTIYTATTPQIAQRIPVCLKNQVSTDANPCITPIDSSVQQQGNGQSLATNGNIGNPSTTTFACPVGFIGVGCQLVCALFGGTSPQCRSWQTATTAGSALTGNPLTGQSTASISSQITGAVSGVIYSLTSDPLKTSIAVALVFLGLGVLAGTLGAGIKADVMAATAVALAVVTYTQLTLVKLGDIPAPILLLFSAVEVPMLIFIVDEAFKGGKGVG